MRGGFRPRGGVEYREQDGELVQVYPPPYAVADAAPEGPPERPVLTDEPDRIVKLTGPRSVASPGEVA